jgi:hypothetical protein
MQRHNIESFTAMTYNLIPFLSSNYPFTPYIHTTSSHLLLFLLPHRTSKPHSRFRIISYHARLHISLHQFTISTLHLPQDGFHQVVRGPPGRSLRLHRQNGKHQGHFRHSTYGRYAGTTFDISLDISTSFPRTQCTFG